LKYCDGITEIVITISVDFSGKDK